MRSTRQILYGLDLISATDGGGNQEYYLYDGLGSTTELADGAGTVAKTYQYDVFGTLRGQTGSSPNEFTFTGEQMDSTGLQYLRARYYDPTIGRFLSQDPLGVGHPYVYASDNPVRYVDPSGLCHEETGLWDYLCGYWAHNKEGVNFGQQYLLCYDYGCHVSYILPANMICFPGPPDQPLPCQEAQYTQGISFLGIELHNPVTNFIDFVERNGRCISAVTEGALQAIRDSLIMAAAELADVPTWFHFVEGSHLTYETTQSEREINEACP